MAMRNVLVTGGAGFIGSNFIRYLLAAEPQVQVINLDALTYAGHPANLADLPDPSRHHFVHGSITDRTLVDDLFRRHAIDTVVHFAAESHVDRSIYGPQPFVETNVTGTFTLLEAARAAWANDRRAVRFHHISTDEVYGSLAPDDPPVDEGAPYAPRSPYAASKAAADHLVRAYYHTYGLPVTLSNCTNNYGPNQFPEKLIPLVILNALDSKPLPVYGDGEQVRDWLHVDDHCAAIHCILTAGKTGETYHVAGGEQPTNLAIVQMLCRLLDERLPDSPHRPHAQLIRHVPDRPGHDRRYALDTSKIRSELGWQPRRTLESGLAETVDWYLTHPEWVAQVTNRPEYHRWLELNYAHRR